MSLRSTVLLALALVAAPTLAAPPTVTVSELACLPNEFNAAISANVEPDLGGTSVRLYFRRLNPVGAYYYDTMIAKGGGDYWTVFPRPEWRQQHLLTDDWWEVLKSRHWVEDKGPDEAERREWLEQWLQRQEEENFEAAEYYIAVYDAADKLLARTTTRLTEVREPEECTAALVDCQRWLVHAEDESNEQIDLCRTRAVQAELGWADNLTVGETTEVQAHRCLFHWECLGVVTRISWQGILHADECCRACVVAGLWPGPAVGAAGVLAGITTTDGGEEVSPERDDGGDG